MSLLVGLATIALALIGAARVLVTLYRGARSMLARLGRRLATLDGATVIASVPPHAVKIARVKP